MVLSRIFDRSLTSRDQRRLILQSGLFDADWYAVEHHLSGGPEKALTHFLDQNGGCNPSARFSSGAYLADNPDVRDAGLNPLLHYLRFGLSEGRVAKDIFGQITGAKEALGKQTIARLRQLFDEAFYRDANPDLLSEPDLFEHFMRVGWRQHRDPAPWFSIKAYLLDHTDVVGTNPAVHFIQTGKSEGRRVRNSRQSRLAICQPSKTKKVRISVVAMVRNEADIIELFASHLLALFDDIVFVDHRSTDGTAEFLTALAKEFQQVQLLKLCEPAYIQSVAMTHVIRENPELRQADWNFFLDADEFLPFRSRDDFESSLTEYHRCPVISMHWQNIVPVEYWSDKVAITPETEFFVPPGFSPLQKVAFQPNKVDIDQITVAQGNHALTATLNGINLRAFNAKFPLLHIPVRSVPQISQKLTQGVRSYDVMGGARDPGQGGHWSRMKQVLEGQTLQDKHLYAMAMNYSEDRQTLIPIERDELVGYSRQRIEFATHPFAQRLVKRDAKDAGENLATIKTRPSVALTTCENGDLVEQVARLAEYEALPPDATQFDLPDLFENSDVAGGDRLASILHHLANRLRPRRYVALGTTCSGGVLALARKARASGFDCESVAVCTHWGNVGLDETARQSFEVFKFELSECCDKVSILQLDAAKASLRFEDASIDILSLEGTLDVTEVSEILERWHSKISDKGMVLLFKGCVQEWSWLQQNAGVQFQNWNVLHFPNYCVMARKQPVAALAS